MFIGSFCSSFGEDDVCVGASSLLSSLLLLEDELLIFVSPTPAPLSFLFDSMRALSGWLSILWV